MASLFLRSPSVLSSLKSNLETKDAKVAGKRKYETEKMMPNKYVLTCSTHAQYDNDIKEA